MSKLTEASDEFHYSSAFVTGSKHGVLPVSTPPERLPATSVAPTTMLPSQPSSWQASYQVQSARNIPSHPPCLSARGHKFSHLSTTTSTAWHPRAHTAPEHCLQPKPTYGEASASDSESNHFPTYELNVPILPSSDEARRDGSCYETSYPAVTRTHSGIENALEFQRLFDTPPSDGRPGPIRTGKLHKTTVQKPSHSAFSKRPPTGGAKDSRACWRCRRYKKPASIIDALSGYLS